MKKRLLFVVAIATAQLSIAQNTFPSTGNTGVGTTTPSELLELKGDTKNLLFSNTNSPGSETGLIFRNNNTTTKEAKILFNTSNSQLSTYGVGGKKILNLTTANTSLSSADIYTLGSANYPLTQMIYAPNSGTGGPGWGQHFAGLVLAGTGTSANKYMAMGITGGEPWIGPNTYATGTSLITPGNEHTIRLASRIKIHPRNNLYNLFDIVNNDVTILDIDQDRTFINTKVGIGTNTFPLNDPDYSLYVKGGIRCQSLNIDLASANGWGDFVFKKGYNLRSLEEVETFVKENSHLPEVPSAKELEEKGIDISEIVKLQMIKIEELTLYVIEQNKKIQALEEKLQK